MNEANEDAQVMFGDLTCLPTKRRLFVASSFSVRPSQSSRACAFLASKNKGGIPTTTTVFAALLYWPCGLDLRALVCGTF